MYRKIGIYSNICPAYVKKGNRIRCTHHALHSMIEEYSMEDSGLKMFMSDFQEKKIYSTDFSQCWCILFLSGSRILPLDDRIALGLTGNEEATFWALKIEISQLRILVKKCLPNKMPKRQRTPPWCEPFFLNLHDTTTVGQWEIMTLEHQSLSFVIFGSLDFLDALSLEFSGYFIL